MTESYLESNGGKVEKRRHTWNLTWPDGEQYADVVFTAKGAEEEPTAKYLTLEDSRIRGLAMRLPRVAPGQPIPVVSLQTLPEDVRGYWSLWRITIQTGDWNRQRIMPLFLHDDSRCLVPTARSVWDQLVTVSPKIDRYIENKDAQTAFSVALEMAEIQGQPIYEELLQAHKKRLVQEREKAEYAFNSRRRALERIGLPTVRNYRLSQLEQEEEAWRAQMAESAKVNPEMVPLVMIRLEAGISRD
ncbi:MAG: hypothetical protein GTO24_15425 [candidate division Zixibacteria bacterium]|nr:hypothetical protein [candidate division Zixibacteria bacterium]